MGVLTDSGDVSARSQDPAATPLRFVTAASLFDGHDAAINIMRRLIQAAGAEVVHLGHNRSVDDVVRAALAEDVDAIAISSYQGGHLEYFRYLVDRLREADAGHVRVFGGGGGTITPAEIAELEAYGVERIYHPDDGMQLGLQGMIDDVIARTRAHRRPSSMPDGVPSVDDDVAIARTISAVEDGVLAEPELAAVRADWAAAAAGRVVPVLGVTGTGGAGKSSVIDELLIRFLAAFDDLHIAVLSVDPTRRRTGGALLGDRIRMNALRSDRIHLRSIATRSRHTSTAAMLGDCIALLKAVGFDLVIVETAGIGQSDSAIVELVDLPVYVMTSDYGAASQLEKIDMVDFAELIVLNKYDRRGAPDALRDIRKQWRRNRVAFDLPVDQVPVLPTIASQFNDPGVTAVFERLRAMLAAHVEAADGGARLALDAHPGGGEAGGEPRSAALIPGARVRYLAEIAEAGRGLRDRVALDVETADAAQAYWRALRDLGDPALPEALAPYRTADLGSADPAHHAGPARPATDGAVRTDGADAVGHSTEQSDRPTAASVPTAGKGVVGYPTDPTLLALRRAYTSAVGRLGEDSRELLRSWPGRLAAITAETGGYRVRGMDIEVANRSTSLSGTPIPKVAAPTYRGWGDLLAFLHHENLPGAFPYTGGVYPYRRTGEDPTRMFAGEGTPERTNRRFHYLSAGQEVARLSTAFDSVTLYGEDPATRPDIYGKVGNSGVNVPTLDDMKKLYSGFDLCAPTTSVSMTINGPAPTILAMFFNAAIDQQVEKYLRADGERWAAAQARLEQVRGSAPVYMGDLPPGHDGLGLALLGVTGDQLVDAQTYARIRLETLAAVRGTVQADILKEDQAQNTCIFSTEFGLRMMGDIQQYFIDTAVRNFYSVSISGYHIAEAGANPITQLAFTLANGFTIVEYYLARGMSIDQVAPHLSFFFSNGMDPEYAVIGRVARRIWARAMRDNYGAGPRSQMLKYHVQTSGRSLHAQEVQFNDIRTTLQALYAIFDNCNSLHTNAYDEAVTTPTEESVRRAVAIQMIINAELGLNRTENPWQGSFIISELTDLVEEAVYAEFEAISDRGGVLGAMETMYQRGRIQDESLLYETRKHDGSLPIIGVNTFLPRQDPGRIAAEIDLIRSTTAEKEQQITEVAQWQGARNPLAPAALEDLQAVARGGGNLFEALMSAVRTHSLGQITHALYLVGGEYRRNM
ncbi:methylmalonyl-CoA mutase [Occultella glacieicola]|uniref:Fused isobutyryl-CoA mutase n=1 Tax=Occultella glacieicola TaxID=2518684 RepID=A0ABY2E073_9MICO|nr:methylmalonyl-CoA mutase family protein [Occultella glacieicola]TDE89998.1 methylmalonyl-CoA mutase [Occultella glacieicola]